MYSVQSCVAHSQTNSMNVEPNPRAASSTRSFISRKTLSFFAERS